MGYAQCDETKNLTCLNYTTTIMDTEEVIGQYCGDKNLCGEKSKYNGVTVMVNCEAMRNIIGATAAAVAMYMAI